jgi:hypothetical protein
MGFGSCFEWCCYFQRDFGEGKRLYHGRNGSGCNLKRRRRRFRVCWRAALFPFGIVEWCKQWLRVFPLGRLRREELAQC